MKRTHTSSAIRIVPVLLGLVGLAVALILAAIAGHFQSWHHALSILSVLSIIGGLFWLQDAKWRESLASLVYTAFFLLCVVLVYLISANRYTRLDITRNKVHTLSQQTKDLLGQLPSDERIIIQVAAPLAEHMQMQQFLSNYRRLAPQIQTEVFDPARDLDMVLALGGRIEDNLLVVIRQNDSGEIIRRETGTLKISDKTREQTLTNTIARSVLAEQGTIYYIQGHGERRLDDSDPGFGRIATIIVESGFPVEPYRLLQGPIPDDCMGLVLAGPATDLYDQEREILQQYLDEGGKLLLLYDPIYRQETHFGNLDQLLASAGVESPNALVVDPISINTSRSPFTPLVMLNTHPVAKYADDAPFMMNQARAFFPAARVNPELKQEVVLRSHEGVWTEQYDDLRSVRTAVPPDDPNGIYEHFLGISVEKATPGGRFGNSMRLLAVGDSDAFTNVHLDQNGGAASFIVGSLNYLKENRSIIYVPPRILESTPVVMTAPTFYALMGGFMFVGLLITVGGTSWALLRRRVK